MHSALLHIVALHFEFVGDSAWAMAMVAKEPVAVVREQWRRDPSVVVISLNPTGRRTANLGTLEQVSVRL
jgi:hypothetical protein